MEHTLIIDLIRCINDEQHLHVADYEWLDSDVNLHRLSWRNDATLWKDLYWVDPHCFLYLGLIQRTASRKDFFTFKLVFNFVIIIRKADFSLLSYLLPFLEPLRDKTVKYIRKHNFRLFSSISEFPDEFNAMILSIGFKTRLLFINKRGDDEREENLFRTVANGELEARLLTHWDHAQINARLLDQEVIGVLL